MAKQVRSYSELSPNPSYELMYEEYLDDIRSSGIILRHKKSSARVAVMSNDDSNKLFCAAFRTPPTNSTGVPHIIEHSVLNGSKHFPSRDPFMQLVKGSLNTFLNAMTYPDKTLYPVATCNDKDFKNLMHVYLDSVFYPNIYKYRQIFMQEGWHYEMENADDELKVNGVVYSEMKGASSSPDNAMWETVSKTMFPDTTYGVNSGGDPAVIPELSYEQFLEFHRSHYHPSNSYIFIYGDCDMDERLEFLDKEYLSNFDKIDPHSEVEHQKHFGSNTPKIVHEKYSVGQTDATDGKSYLVFSSLGGSNLDVLEARAASVVAYVLFNAEGAPVKQALLDAGIGEEVFGYYDSHQIEDTFTIVAKYAKSEDSEKFYNIIMDTLHEQVKNGISEKAILATLNSREFSFREADYSGYPRGLDVATDMLQSWLYDDSTALSYMHYLDDCAELKKKIGTGYFENIIKKYILESDHCALITIDPERGLNDKKNEELKEKLESYKKSLSAEEIQKIVDDTKELREYQNHVPTEEEQNCIPSLERSDIPREGIPYYNEEITVGGTKTVFHDVDTNGITYANIYFNVGKLPREYVPYLSVLGDVLGRVDTAKHTYNELNFDKLMNLGGIWFGPATYTKYKTLDDYTPLYGIYTKMMSDKTGYALELAKEIVLTSKLDDKKRLRDILAEMKSGKRNEIINNGNSVAGARARSYFSKVECYYQDLGGIDFYLFLSDLLDNWDAKADEFIEKLTAVKNYVFNPATMFLDLASDKQGRDILDEKLPAFAKAIGEVEHGSLGEFVDYIPEKKNEGILIPSQVQYAAQAGNLVFDGNRYNGTYRVVQSAINIDYLYQQIRVKGGAYGCGCGFDSYCDNLTFTTYRDPKLAESYNVFKGTGEFIRNYDFDEKELTKFIIGAFSGYERPLSNAGKARRSFSAYMTGITYEDVLRERAEMLDITKEQFKASADVFDKVCAQGYICTVGNETKLKENAELFDTLITIN